jgi:hypothetical protein
VSHHGSRASAVLQALQGFATSLCRVVAEA